MGGRFVRWRKFAQQDHDRVCPLCNKDIEFRLYPEEIWVRIFTMAVAIGAAYYANERGAYLAAFAGMAAILVVAYVAVSLRLRNRQRFQKRRAT